MDYINAIKTAYDVGTQAIGDYQRGKQIRLGQYNGADNIRQIGHFNKQGKRLAIYHG